MTTAWTIAGSDSSGYAGIQADLMTFKNFNIHTTCIITAITAQNSDSVNSIYHLPHKQFSAQLQSRESVPNAIKVGMLGKASQVSLLISFLSQHNIKVVLDPVMFSTSGYPLFKGSLSNYIKSLKKLLPYITLITPNIHEAEILTDTKINTFKDIKKACQKILSMGAKNVFIKGGHFNDNNFSQDLWTDGEEYLWLSTKRHHSKNIRGTGCTFSSAITSCLANNYCIKDAIVIAKMYISQYIRTNRFYHKTWVEDAYDLPTLHHSPITKENLPFPACDLYIGLYPIVDSLKWVKLLLPLGVRTIQLRIKDKMDDILEKELIESIEFAKKIGAQLFINDYWQLAIKHKAYGVHLGQEDLERADINAIRNAGLRLGISTHSYYEIARAHALKPSYIAFGPIFPTTSKLMSFDPQGLNKLRHWCKLLNYPIVAIGGINHSNFRDVYATGVNGIAMISAITQAKNPITSAKFFLHSYKTHALK